MKNFILLALAALMMVGCVYRTDAEIEEAKRLKGFNIIVIDSCEYLKSEYFLGHQGYGFFAHKGNCRFCKERRQKEMEELVIDSFPTNGLTLRALVTRKERKSY